MGEVKRQALGWVSLMGALATVVVGCPLEPFDTAGCRPGACNDGNVCTTDVCDEATGQCQFEPVAIGTDCSNDGDVCNGIETCNAEGICSGSDPVDIDDGDDCTSDACDPLTGFVSHDPIAGCEIVEAGWMALPTEGAPSPRALHSMVWTGSEVLVWGGRVTGNPLAVNDGARYDPVTDSWSPISTVGAPSPRHSHSAVWTGTEMLVWGGFGESDYETDGGRYDPVTDSWMPINTQGAPQGRTFHATVWTGTHLFIWGGLQDITVLPGGAFYDPVGDVWTDVNPNGAPAQRQAAGALWTGDEVMIWGGGDTFDWLDTGGFFSPAGNQWTGATPSTDVPRFREQPSAAWTGTQAVIWGGWDGANYLLDGATLTPGDNAWEPLTDVNAPNPRARHLTLWADDQLFVWGGCAGQACGTIQGDGGLWVPGANGGTWKPVVEDELLSPRRDPRGVWTGTEVILWGGRDDGGNLGDGARAVLDSLDR